MAKSKNPNTYSPEAAVLDAALSALKTTPSVIYETASYAEAVAFRSRAYHLRLLLRDLNAKTVPPGFAPSSKYDHLFLQIPGKEAKVIISLRKPAGTLITQDGTRIPIGDARDVQRDPLQNDLDDLMEGLK